MSILANGLFGFGQRSGRGLSISRCSFAGLKLRAPDQHPGMSVSLIILFSVRTAQPNRENHIGEIEWHGGPAAIPTIADRFDSSVNDIAGLSDASRVGLGNITRRNAGFSR